MLDGRLPGYGSTPLTAAAMLHYWAIHVKAKKYAHLRNSDDSGWCFGEGTRPRVQGSAPSLNPTADVSDEGVADRTRGRVRSRIFPFHPK
jgi:hypothetical protein